MYLRNVKISAARSIRRAALAFEEGAEAGWHVVIGANGTGKSTLIRAIVLALIGERDIEASLVDLGRWVRPGGAPPEIEVTVTGDVPDDEGPSRPAATHHWSVVIVEDEGGRGFQAVLRGRRSSKPWQQGSGWFSAAYGPFRRLSGGDRTFDTPRIRSSRLGAHMSALNDGFALSEAESWLVDLYVEEMEATKALIRSFEDSPIGTEVLRSFALMGAAGDVDGRDVLLAEAERGFADMESQVNRRMRHGRVKAVMRAILTEDLEGGTVDLTLTVHSVHRRIIRFFNDSGFLFDDLKVVGVDGEGVSVMLGDVVVRMSQLSDGFRAVLAIGLETLRLMHASYGPERLLRHLDDSTGALDLPGVVLIDEIEAHLHPPWQEEVGAWLMRRFPRVQFIVTTHSPIVCRSMAADDGTVRGSLWEFRADDDDEESLRRVEGQRLGRLVFGDLVEAVGTNAFGRHVAQSDAAADLLDRLAELNRLQVRGTLDAEGRSELATLRGTFPTRAPDPGDDA